MPTEADLLRLQQIIPQAPRIRRPQRSTTRIEICPIRDRFRDLRVREGPSLRIGRHHRLARIEPPEPLDLPVKHEAGRSPHPLPDRLAEGLEVEGRGAEKV